MELKFTDENFEEEVLKAEQLTMVDFYADWCGPCKVMGPVVEELAKEYEGIAKIGKLNVDDNPQAASSYKVMSIPTIIFFKDGKAVKTQMGVVPIATLKDIINTNK